MLALLALVCVSRAIDVPADSHVYLRELLGHAPVNMIVGEYPFKISYNDTMQSFNALDEEMGRAFANPKETYRRDTRVWNVAVYDIAERSVLNKDKCPGYTWDGWKGWDRMTDNERWPALFYISINDLHSMTETEKAVRNKEIDRMNNGKIFRPIDCETGEYVDKIPTEHAGDMIDVTLPTACRVNIMNDSGEVSHSDCRESIDCLVDENCHTYGETVPANVRAWRYDMAMFDGFFLVLTSITRMASMRIDLRENHFWGYHGKGRALKTLTEVGETNITGSTTDVRIQHLAIFSLDGADIYKLIWELLPRQRTRRGLGNTCIACSVKDGVADARSIQDGINRYTSIYADSLRNINNIMSRINSQLQKAHDFEEDLIERTLTDQAVIAAGISNAYEELFEDSDKLSGILADNTHALVASLNATNRRTTADTRSVIIEQDRNMRDIIASQRFSRVLMGDATFMNQIQKIRENMAVKEYTPWFEDRCWLVFKSFRTCFMYGTFVTYHRVPDLWDIDDSNPYIEGTIRVVWWQKKSGVFPVVRLRHLTTLGSAHLPPVPEFLYDGRGLHDIDPSLDMLQSDTFLSILPERQALRAQRVLPYYIQRSTNLPVEQEGFGAYISRLGLREIRTGNLTILYPMENMPVANASFSTSPGYVSVGCMHYVFNARGCTMSDNAGLPYPNLNTDLVKITTPPMQKIDVYCVQAGVTMTLTCSVDSYGISKVITNLYQYIALDISRDMNATVAAIERLSAVDTQIVDFSVTTINSSVFDLPSNFDSTYDAIRNSREASAELQAELDRLGLLIDQMAKPLNDGSGCDGTDFWGSPTCQGNRLSLTGIYMIPIWVVLFIVLFFLDRRYHLHNRFYALFTKKKDK